MSITAVNFRQNVSGGKPQIPTGFLVAKSLLILPSTYGLLVWTASILLAQTGIVPAYPISYIGWIIFIFVATLFLLSMWMHFGTASDTMYNSFVPPFRRLEYFLFISTTVIGVYGLYTYIIDTSAGLGSIIYFFQDLVSSSLSIRKESQSVESIGFQISYFSWISIFLGAYVIIRTPAHPFVKFIVGAIILVEFLLNLTFVARTRPIWILLTTGLAIYFAKNALTVRVKLLLAVTTVLPISLFVVFALFTGKYDAGRGAISSLIEYLISGPLYLDAILNESIRVEDLPLRTLYPISKLLEVLGMTANVPDPLLPFRFVPFPTNVGTFLEPLYMDGGLFFVAVGSFLLIFGIDRLALFAFRQNSPYGRYMWANLIFAQLLCFFAPRYNTPAIYLFIFIYIFMSLLNRAVRYDRYSNFAPLRSSGPYEQTYR